MIGRTGFLCLIIASCSQPSRGGPTPRETAAAAVTRSYGHPIDSTRPMTPLGDLMLRPGAYDGKDLIIEGTVKQVVCRGMGCWMELEGAIDNRVAVVTLVGAPYDLPRKVSRRRVAVAGRVLASKQPNPAVSIEATGIELR